MSFASDLLDGFELLYKRTEGVLKSCTEASEFFKDLAKCEREYAQKLTKLASSQKRDFIQKAHAVQKEVGTTSTAWDTTLTELEKIAEHHNQTAEKIDNDIVKAITNYVKEKKKERQRLETEGKKLTSSWKQAQENLKRTRDKYVTLSREADQAEAVHTKGKGDMNMKPNQLAKLAAKHTQAAEKAAASDNEYQACLSLTNQKQADFYTSTMPALLREFQQFEEDRLRFMKEILQKFASYVSDRPPFYSSASETITAIIESVNVDSDIQSYVGENRTNVTPPEDIQYIPYNSEVPKPHPNPKPGPGPAPRPGPKYKPGSDVDILSSKAWGLTASDANLSVDEQHRKLSSQLDELDKAINSETKTKQGLENLVRFYASDPVSQKKAEDQLNESDSKLQRLNETRNMVLSQLEQSGGSHSITTNNNNPMTNSYSSSSNNNNSAGGGAGKFSMKVRGLYDYTATCETELSFKEGDILTISEKDDSGWWYAELNGQAGFVPNNYVEMIR